MFSIGLKEIFYDILTDLSHNALIILLLFSRSILQKSYVTAAASKNGIDGRTYKCGPKQCRGTHQGPQGLAAKACNLV